MSLILSKSRKSLQLRLNDFFMKLEEPPVTSSAFTQARAKLKHTAFIELNEKSLVRTYYEDSDYKRYKDLRLLAIDGSKLRLPETDDVAKEFGKIKVVTSNGEQTYVGSQSSVLYDVLNEIVIDAKLGTSVSSERKLAAEHLELTGKGDLIIMDRGYAGYELFASVIQQGSDFLTRCQTANSFEAIKVFLTEDIDEKIVTLYSSKKSKKAVREKGLSNSLEVRLIKVLLPTGEIELLITSLLDQQRYPIEDFKDLYFKRWGIETFFGRIKGRLDLEAFTGKSAESVKQDFFATIYVSNLETICTEEVNVELEKKSKKNAHPQKVNKAVSFNIVKNNILDIMFDPFIANSELEDRIDRAFRNNPTIVRPDRNPERVITTQTKNNRWLRHYRKFVF